MLHLQMLRQNKQKKNIYRNKISTKKKAERSKYLIQCIFKCQFRKKKNNNLNRFRAKI